MMAVVVDAMAEAEAAVVVVVAEEEEVEEVVVAAEDSLLARLICFYSDRFPSIHL